MNNAQIPIRARHHYSDKSPSPQFTDDAPSVGPVVAELFQNFEMRLLFRFNPRNCASESRLLQDELS